MAESPFENIENAQEYVDLLLEALHESRKDVDKDLAETGGNGATRRRDALLLVAHQLNLLSMHLAKSSRILNDLRSLRRLLLEERGLAAPAVPVKEAATREDIAWH